MKSGAQRKLNKKIALVLSMCTILIWAILGTGASLAWFNDTTPEINNIFHFADFDLVVSHRLPDGSYKEIDEKTKLFDEYALYEPGYVQVVYLKVENQGDIAFDFNTAVSVTDYTVATSVYGTPINLQDHLRFGVVTADEEAELKEKLADREKAVSYADRKLNNYATEKAELKSGEDAYMALIVCMPEEVGNEANYRGKDIPMVELGIIVKADQQKATE